MALNPSSGWSYYKQLNISDTNDVSANYQMQLKVYAGEGTDDPDNGIVYCDNHCENFPNDIRFGTTDDPSTAEQLPQWIESYDSSVAIIWVKLPSDGSDTIYMFVGNSSASLYSDGSETFIYFEDFSTDTTSTYTSTRASDNKSTHYTKDEDVGYEQALLCRIKITHWDTGEWGCTIRWGYSNKDMTDGGSMPEDALMMEILNDEDDGAKQSPPTMVFRAGTRNSSNGTYTSYDITQEFSLDTYYKIELRAPSASNVYGVVYDDDYSELNSTDSSSDGPSESHLNYLWLHNWDCNESGHLEEFVWDSSGHLKRRVRRDDVFSEQIIYTDWQLIRKYTSPEPTWSSFGEWTSCKYNLRIYSSAFSSNLWCTRWDEDNWRIIIEAIADKTTRDNIRNNIVPGAVAELYNILGKPQFVDTTYSSGNTITLLPKRMLSNLRDEVTVAVKSYSETMIRWDMFRIKLECVKL